MSYFLGSTSNANEFLLLKNNKKINFSLNTKSIPGTKKYFNSNYLNVVNPNTNLSIEVEIDKIKFNHENKFYSVMLRVTSVGIKYFQKKY
jgi:hypothetical protein